MSGSVLLMWNSEAWWDLKSCHRQTDCFISKNLTSLMACGGELFSATTLRFQTFAARVQYEIM